MKKLLLTFASLFLVMSVTVPLRADDDAQPKDVPIYPRPQDFATAQQLALQNRQERISLMQRSAACIQQSTTFQEMTACRQKEAEFLNKIWLSYCDSNAYLPGMDNESQPQEPTMDRECQKALKHVKDDSLALSTAPRL